MTDVAALRPGAGATHPGRVEVPVEQSGPPASAPPAAGDSDVLVRDAGPTTANPTGPSGPRVTDPDAVRGPAEAEGDGGFLGTLGNVFGELFEIVSHPYAQAGLALTPGVMQLAGLPVLGQVVSGFMAIFSLGRVAGALFPPEGSELAGKSLGERLSAALPDLAISSGWLLGALVPGVGVVGPIFSGLFGMVRGEREVAARQERERRALLEAEADTAAQGATPPSAPLPPGVTEATARIPNDLNEAFEQPQKAQAVADALQAIRDAQEDARGNEALLSALEREYQEIVAAISQHALAAHGRAVNDNEPLNPETLAILLPLLAPEAQQLLSQPTRDVD